MRTERLKLVASKVELGLLRSVDLSDAAVRALEDGCDSPSLRILAGLSVAEADEAGAMFDRVLAELNVPRPSKRDAVMHLAQDIAEEISSRTTAPYEGAVQIWELSLRLPEESFSELDSFVYAASEWVGRPEDCHVFEDGIVTAAKELVSSRQS